MTSILHEHPQQHQQYTSFRDKIRMYEGRTVSTSDLRRNNTNNTNNTLNNKPHTSSSFISSPRTSSSPVTGRFSSKPSNGESSKNQEGPPVNNNWKHRTVEFPHPPLAGIVPNSHTPSRLPMDPIELPLALDGADYTPTQSPNRFNSPLNLASIGSTMDKGKGKEQDDKAEQDTKGHTDNGDVTMISPRTPHLEQLPENNASLENNTKSNSHNKYEEEEVTMKRMTDEEKQIVKQFVKIIQQKVILSYYRYFHVNKHSLTFILFRTRN